MRRPAPTAVLHATLALALCLASIATPPRVAASPVDLVCQGDDDTQSLQALLDATSEAGGGSVVIGGPSPCSIHTDLHLKGRTSLRGDPSASVVASKEGRFERGLIRCEGSDLTLSDLELDVTTQAIPALTCATTTASGRIRLERIRVSAATPTSAPLVGVDCSGARGPCLLARDLEIDCGTAPTPATAAVAVSGSGAARASADLARVTVRGCEHGILVHGMAAAVRDSTIRVAGENATAIEVPSDANVVENEVRVLARGTEPAFGILAGAGASIVGNRVMLQGGSGVAVQAGRDSRVSGNSVRLRRSEKARAIVAHGRTTIDVNRIATTKSPGAIGVTLRGSHNVVADNISTLETGGDSTHVLAESDQNLVNGNEFAAGDWGVRPPIFEEGAAGGFTNGARLTGNNMIYLAKGCAVLETGWHASANHCSWIEPGATGFWIGSPGPFGGSSTHSLLAGNTIHAADSSSALIRFASVGRRCTPEAEAGAPRGSLCTNANDCADGERCARLVCRSVGIMDNLLLGSQSASTLIDVFGPEADSSDLPRMRSIQVMNNSVAMNRSSVLVRFRDDQPPHLMRDFSIRGNAPAANERVTGWHESFGHWSPEHDRARRDSATAR